MYPGTGVLAPAAGTGVAITGGLMGSTTMITIGLVLVFGSFVLYQATRLRKNANKAKN